LSQADNEAEAREQRASPKPSDRMWLVPGTHKWNLPARAAGAMRFRAVHAERPPHAALSSVFCLLSSGLCPSAAPQPDQPAKAKRQQRPRGWLGDALR
jgi:hypothetical protein